ncbi:MLO-like protein 11 [Platanthera guangdongensis]|uniref:MLO-like protein 11 n=1 Tax=Platanthera guangdongensis TaxID=2320717 RepID=A0ABR2MD36_9ASPA
MLLVVGDISRLCRHMPIDDGTQLVLLVGTKLQHVIATLALESAGITGSLFSSSLKPRDGLFWFKKPEFLLSLIHFILFQDFHTSKCAFMNLLTAHFAGEDIYGGSDRLLSQVVPRKGIVVK